MRNIYIYMGDESDGPPGYNGKKRSPEERPVSPRGSAGTNDEYIYMGDTMEGPSVYKGKKRSPEERTVSPPASGGTNEEYIYMGDKSDGPPAYNGKKRSQEERAGAPRALGATVEAALSRGSNGPGGTGKRRKRDFKQRRMTLETSWKQRNPTEGVSSGSDSEATACPDDDDRVAEGSDIEPECEDARASVVTISADLLQKRLKLKPKGATGPDGWAIQMLLKLPEGFFAALAALWNGLVHNEGRLPSAWTQTRIVTIEKPEDESGARRPISIASVLWRLCAGSQLVSMTDWVAAWMPHQLFGGIKGRSLEDAH